MSPNDDYLNIFARDKRGRNFFEFVQSIDYGYTEFWSLCLWYDEEESEWNFFTQYNPPPMCDEGEKCMHFPRNHVDDCVVSFEGETVSTGSCVLPDEEEEGQEL